MLVSKIRQRIARLTILSVIGCVLLSGGCLTPGVRTVYVPPTQPVRLRENLKKVKIWVADSAGVWQESEMDLQEGWYVIADPGK